MPPRGKQNANRIAKYMKPSYQVRLEDSQIAVRPRFSCKRLPEGSRMNQRQLCELLGTLHGAQGMENTLDYLCSG